jgi:two-component system, NtrC family, response regulator AtoC
MYIVIVEDQQPIAQNLQELLTHEGHTTRIAANVGEGRKMIRARQPDLVFLDIHLPDGSGLDLLDFADVVKFIIITGTPREESLNTAFDHGAVAYLVKPFSLQDVLDAIKLAGES